MKRPEQETHHYPPELKSLLIDAIPRLIKGKLDVLNFFKGCGVAPTLYADLARQVRTDRQSIKKFDLVRQVIDRVVSGNCAEPVWPRIGSSELADDRIGGR